MHIGANRGGLALSPNSFEKAQNVKRLQAADSSLAGINLVTLEAAPNPMIDPYRSPRTLATFVTQLIAGSKDAPMTRLRRRIDPAARAKINKNMSDIVGVPKRYKMRPF